MDGRNVYQYVADGMGRTLPSADDAAELVHEAQFYDFEELTDFIGEMKVIAYAIQTDGYENAETSDVWATTVQAIGE